jgi:hypothetical protein
MVETAWCWHQARHRIAIPSTADPGGVAR